jgi:hypothetical protein
VTLIPASCGRPTQSTWHRQWALDTCSPSCGPTRTASSPPSDPSNRTINTLDSSANRPAPPAYPSLLSAYPPRLAALPLPGPESPAFPSTKFLSRLDLV